MKKILLALFLFLTAVVYAQNIAVISGGVPTIGGGSYSTEYQAVYNQLATPPTTYDEAQDAFVVALVSAGYWSRIDAMWVFAQETNSGNEAYINWKNPTGTRASGINSPTFTANQGFTGNDNNMAVNLNWIPSSAAVNYTQNDAAIVFYSRTAAAQSTETSVGGGDGTRSIFCSPYYADGSTYLGINEGGYSSQPNPDATGAGCFMFVRTSSTARQVYRNGVLNLTQAGASNGLPTVTQYALAFNNNGTIDEPSSRQLSIVLFMDALNGTEAAALNTIIETFADAVGFGVQ